MNIMDEEKVMAEVMNLLEAEPAPSALPAALPATNIPELREQLAILVSTGKCKEAIGVNLHGTKNWIYSKFDLDQKSRSNTIIPLIQTLTRVKCVSKMLWLCFYI